MIEQVNNLAELELEELVALRRHMHQHPEPSGSEYESTVFLADTLDRYSIPFRFGPDQRGLVVDLGDPQATHRVALRADIDAIPIRDSKHVEYHSRRPDCMHACGHDAHSTMLVGALYRLKDWFDRQPRPGLAVRGLFQPEEETAKGAVRLIQDGVLDRVHAIIGQHVDPTRPTGTVGLRAGVVTASCDEVIVEIQGRSGHAARPHETIDPIAAASQFIQTAYSSLNRNINTHHPTVFTVCEFQGGNSSNVTPDHVRLRGTLRTVDVVARDLAVDRIEQVAKGVESTTDAIFEVRFGNKVPAMETDSVLTGMVREALVQFLGADRVQNIELPSMGGEDFAFYSQRVPAGFLRLGCAGARIGHLPLHNSAFDIDEDVLPIGAMTLSQSAIHFLESSESDSGHP